MKNIIALGLKIFISGCAFLPGSFTYIQYIVYPGTDTVPKWHNGAQYKTESGVVEFSFEPTDSSISKNLHQRGEPYKLDISVLFPRKYSGLKLKTLQVIQDEEIILEKENIKTQFISDSAIGRGKNSFLYTVVNDTIAIYRAANERIAKEWMIKVSHRSFRIKFEFWSDKEKVIEGDFPFIVEKEKSTPNRHIGYFWGMT